MIIRMGSWVHRIDGVDEKHGMVICTNCGIVPLVWKTVKGVRVAKCSVAKEQQRGSRGTKKGSHGLTIEEARALREGKCCEICGSEEKLHVDHNHDTNALRGILCHNCNVGIGFLKDSTHILTSAIQYLTKYEGLSNEDV